MSEIKRFPNLLLKPFNLISYVQELSQVSVLMFTLPQVRLVD